MIVSSWNSLLRIKSSWTYTSLQNKDGRSCSLVSKGAAHLLFSCEPCALRCTDQMSSAALNRIFESTGLQGKSLRAAGFARLTGIDQSAELLAAARGTGDYANLHEADMNARLDLFQSGA